ncbi:hypothetical protein TNIN_305911 [Trichonephila inaurata madagascariensis]|uniref:Uncharacterized protein n=1 Tax=Trichonephila inaurata madagascariensis TaxID=2747483 RepID=A0A8X6YVI5_9ARAC|nr:hypothetical protein TNIN_305911 [Trichonephila inaurata madagascariensis]
MQAEQWGSILMSSGAHLDMDHCTGSRPLLAVHVVGAYDQSVIGRLAKYGNRSNGWGAFFQGSSQFTTYVIFRVLNAYFVYQFESFEFLMCIVINVDQIVSE